MRLLRACRREAVDCTPVWFMRQAGRFLPEYRKLRSRHSLLELCTRPELAAKVTLLPLKRFPDIDAVILFSDILLVPRAMGVALDFQHEGPVIAKPIRKPQDVAALRPVEVERDLAAPLEALRIVRSEVDGKVPVIGFAGGPFTVASYLIEGGQSRDYTLTKSFMYGDPTSWRSLMDKLSGVTAAYLQSQVKAGAQVIQLFDSWVGTLSPADYREYVLPWMRRIFVALHSVPTIHYATGSAALLRHMQEAGGDVIGIDWRIALDDAWSRLEGRGVQGNLDPAVLLAPRALLLKRVDEILERAAGKPGHIFNLGHGVLPRTMPEDLEAVIRHVHDRSRR